MTKSQISKILRVVATAVDALDSGEFEGLLSGKGKLVYVAFDRTERDKATQPSAETNATIERLKACEDRDVARQILSSVQNKGQLKAIAKAMKVHIVKQDSRANIEEKLVEFAIGSRLRSDAIKTLNLKGGRGNGDA